MKDTNENQKQHHEDQDKPINFQTLGNICLMIIVVLIIGNAILIYYLMNSQNESENLAEVEIENTSSQENVDSLGNILNGVVTNAISNTNSSQTTVDSTDLNTKKLMNENLIVLYNGLILDTSKMDQVELKYIDNTNNQKDKYVITYYNYQNFVATGSTLGQLSNPIYENLVRVQNVAKIAVSENYNAIPRNIKIINTIPNVITDNNNLKEYDSSKTVIADLDGDGIEEYIIILSNKNIGYSKISLYDSSGKWMADLAYSEKSKWSQSGIEYYFSLDNINILDIDNDNIMEILVEIPKYEGDPSVSMLKYKNGEITGKTNIECSLLP